jgi:hypothetical protein
VTRTDEARTAPLALRSWLMKGVPEDRNYLGPHPSPQQTEKTHRWWQVMCLTGVDYFSTLGYQPGIAALAAGLISPIATLVLVALTLLGALPVYRRVASESPNGEGSIAMLERLMSFWKGKILVLVLLGFAATDFIITMTLSAADATAHLVENPHLEPFLAGHQVVITLVLLALLGGVFLRGFTEAIGVAVALVALYLGLNVVVIADGIAQVLAQPALWTDWRVALTQQHGSPLVVVDNDLTDPNDVIFVEVTLTDPSEFASRLDVCGEVQHSRYRVLTFSSSTVPNALAALLLAVRDQTERLPHIYFEWSEGNPAANLVRFLLFGAGEVAPVTREIIRRAEPDRERRPHVHVG